MRLIRMINKISFERALAQIEKNNPYYKDLECYD